MRLLALLGRLPAPVFGWVTVLALITAVLALLAMMLTEFRAGRAVKDLRDEIAAYQQPFLRVVHDGKPLWCAQPKDTARAHDTVSRPYRGAQ